jgi:hypothetical protein
MEPLREEARELPEYIIAGIRFAYDAALDEFRQCSASWNKIPMKALWEENSWTQFFLDKRTNNVYTGGFPNGERPGHVYLVITPSIPYLARVGIKVLSLQEKREAAASKVKRKHKKGRRI